MEAGRRWLATPMPSGVANYCEVSYPAIGGHKDASGVEVYSHNQVRAWLICRVDWGTVDPPAERFIFYSGTCSSRTSETRTFVWQGSGAPTAGCRQGCAYEVVASGGGTVSFEVDGQTYHSGVRTISPTGDLCDADQAPENLDQKDTTDDGWKCHQDTGHCTDPDGNNHFCTLNPDGTRSQCVPARRDEDGKERPPGDPPKAPEGAEGEGDTNTPGEGKVSGGLDCDTGPACTGDVIQCAQLYQQWKTRCAVQSMGSGEGTGEVVSGQDCAQGFQCTAGPVQCALLLEQRRARCEAAARWSLDGLSPPTDYDGDPDEHKGSIWSDGTGQGGFSFDQSGFAAGACPTLSLGSIGMINTSPMCSVASWLSLLFQSIALLWGIQIVMRS